MLHGPSLLAAVRHDEDRSGGSAKERRRVENEVVNAILTAGPIASTTMGDMLLLSVEGRRECREKLRPRCS